MTEEEKIICKQFLNDADKTHSCNEYKLLMALLEQEPTTKNDLALICTWGLDEEIRCTMCTNSMKSDRGCDGSCVVNKGMYKAVMDAIERRIQPTPKNNLVVDAVSRKAVDDALYDFWHDVNIVDDSGLGIYQDSIDVINELPPAIPIRPKGHWIEKPHVYGVVFCSECDFELKINNTNYCPNCGAEMESEVGE